MKQKTIGLKLKKGTALAATLALSMSMASGALAKDVKIGFITSLSTGGGYLGQDIYDAFMLAVEENGGKLGGHKVKVLVEDDARKPGTGKQIAKRYIQREKIDIITGIVFSNVLGAVAPTVLREGKIYVSANAAPSTFAGKECHKNYFSTAFQNNTLHETAGMLAQKKGYKSAYVLAANYLAGKDAIAGFKSAFKGKILGESLVKLGTTEYAAELAKIRAANPEVVFQFLPGGMGINFHKQYAQAKIGVPQVVSFSALDEKFLTILGDSSLGVITSAQWSPDLDNPLSKKFVANFKAKYKRTPTVYASQGYDTANWIASALKHTGGDTNPDKIRAALKKLDYKSVRGDYKLNTNHHPIQTWYGRIATKGSDGKIYQKTYTKIENVGDHFAKLCSH